MSVLIELNEYVISLSDGSVGFEIIGAIVKTDEIEGDPRFVFQSKEAGIFYEAEDLKTIYEKLKELNSSVK